MNDAKFIGFRTKRKKLVWLNIDHIISIYVNTSSKPNARYTVIMANYCGDLIFPIRYVGFFFGEPCPITKI